jgi:hypothetical protein
MKKMSVIKLIILLLICCDSCSPVSKSKNSEILPMDSVVVLIAECYFLEGEICIKQWEYDTKDYSLVKYEDFFAKHKVTKEIFLQNVKYYLANPKYTEVFLEKIDRIVEQLATAYRDSIQEVNHY